MVTKVSQHTLVASSLTQLKAGLKHHRMHKFSILCADFKCPYAKQDDLPYEAFADADICGEFVSEQF